MKKVPVCAFCCNVVKILIDSMALCVSIMHVMKVCDRVFAY